MCALDKAAKNEGMGCWLIPHHPGSTKYETSIPAQSRFIHHIPSTAFIDLLSKISFPQI